MRVLVLSGYGVKLGASGSSLVVKSKKGERKIPAAEVDAVLLATGGIAVTSKAMRLMLMSGIELIVLNGRGDPVGILYSSHYTRTADTRRAQYMAIAEDRGLAYAKAFARCKILSQASTLWRLSSDLGFEEGRRGAEEVASYAGKLSEISGPLEEARLEVMSIEAAAARAYWSLLARLVPGDLGFDGRDPDSGDPVNAALNYGYGILYALAWRSLVLAGLDPYAGFLHTDRSGRPVLAFDYVEMWRAPLVDETLVRLAASGWRPRVESGLLTHDSRMAVAEAIARRLKQQCPGAPYSMSFERALRSYAIKLASALRRSAPYKCYDGGWS